MRHFFRQVDALLRGENESSSWRHSLWYCVFFGLLYGAAMGCFGGLGAQRWAQIAFSACKVPLLLIVSFGFALPPFFVINTLLGGREEFAKALSAILEAQAALSMVLLSLAPLTLGFYISFSSYEAAVLFNFLIFAIASFSAQIIMRRRYRILIARRPIHRRLMWAWLACYGFVGVQMGWVLRPFIGAPNAPTHFFRAGGWGNVYEVLFAMLWRILS